MIKLVQLYSDIMSTYGDRGNVIYIEHFLRQNDKNFETYYHTYGQPIPEADIYVFGGGQDSSQLLVSLDLTIRQGNVLKKYLKNAHCLAVCGGYQLLGKYYMQKDGTVIDGLGYLPVVTVAGPERMVGHVAGKRFMRGQARSVVGFENHSGKTYILDNSAPLLRVPEGKGNNGVDGTEGIVFQKTIGTYLHGPVLPRNPHLLHWWLRDLVSQLNKPNLTWERKAHRRIVSLSV